jgi:outer membrane receptor protein involved in Fe transport
VNTNSFWLPAYTVFDLGARYKLSETLSLMANVRNLTDKTYYTGSSTTTSVLVGSPRAFTVEVKAGF